MSAIDSILNPIRYIFSDDFSLRVAQWRLSMLSRIPMGLALMRKRNAIPTSHLSLEAFGMKFHSRIGLGAGYDRNGEFVKAMEATGFGFIEIGTITPKPQKSDISPALHRFENDRALLYCGQTQCDGVERVIENIKQYRGNIIVGCNIAKNDSTAEEDAPQDYLRLFRPLYQYADYFTVNIARNSSAKPYVPTNREQIMAILQPLFEFRRGQNQYRPILLKISPDLSDEQIDLMTDIMIDTPLDGIVACAGTTGRHGLENSTSAVHAIGRKAGALSGAPLRERALEVVRRIHSRAQGTYPIIGCGGISTADDALAMLEAGASLVQVTTEYIYNGERSIRDMRAGLNERLRKAQQRQKSEAAAE